MSTVSTPPHASRLTLAQRVGVTAVSVAVGLVTALFNPAWNSAHSAEEWYGQIWTGNVQSGINTDRAVDWRFVDNFPLGDGFRNRVKDGAAKWNALAPNVHFDFEANPPDYAGLGFDNPCPVPTQNEYQQDKVGWQPLPDNWIGEAYYCPINNTAILYFRMRFDSQQDWYTGTGNPGSGQDDLWGAAAHEFGHAGGRLMGGDGAGHFTQQSTNCPNFGSPDFADRHTMCKTQIVGTSIQRSLEEHDRDVFRNAYP